MTKLMSEREANECATYGEVQTWSDTDKQEEVSMSYLAESLKNTPRTSLEDTGPEEDVNVGTDLEETESPEKMVGSKIAREFGKGGIYLGEVLRIEYDSEDEDKVRPKYNSTQFSMSHR